MPPRRESVRQVDGIRRPHEAALGAAAEGVVEAAVAVDDGLAAEERDGGTKESIRAYARVSARPDFAASRASSCDEVDSTQLNSDTESAGFLAGAKQPLVPVPDDAEKSAVEEPSDAVPQNLAGHAGVVSCQSAAENKSEAALHSCRPDSRDHAGVS